MPKSPDREYHRRPGFMQSFAAEAERMHAPAPPPSPPAARDEAVLLPILLLLMSEGADKWLLLAILYILF